MCFNVFGAGNRRRGHSFPTRRSSDLRASLLIARLLWGLSFAAMNIATQALATAEPTGAARRNGRMRAIIAAGPVSGLIGRRLNSRHARTPAAVFVLNSEALLAFPFSA